MAGNFHLRPASSADLPGLVTLERASFTDPWTAAQLSSALRDATVVSLVREEDDESLAGYVLGRIVVDEGEVLTLAVHPSRRRAGIGRQLLEAMLDAMAARGVHSVWLEVRVSNAAARAMYAASGFVAAGVRRGYYRRPVEDALVLRRTVRPAASAGPPMR